MPVRDAKPSTARTRSQRSLRLGVASCLALGALLASAPLAAEKPAAAPPDRIRILVLDLKGHDVAEPVVRTIQGLVTVELARYQQLDVVSGEDLSRMLELEADKQTAGCTDNSCLAEIAGAMGAELVLFGEVGALGELKVLNLSLFDQAELRAIGRTTVQESQLERLPDKLRPALKELLAQSKRASALGTAAPAEPSTLPLVLLGAGGGVAGLGLVLGGGATALTFLGYQRIADEIRALEEQGPTSIGQAQDKQEELDQQRRPVLVTGIATGAVVLVGAALAGVGALLMVGGDEAGEEAGGAP